MKTDPAVVKVKVNGVLKSRKGRGYSESELREAGIKNSRIAKSLGILVDENRKTIHEENAKYLKKVLGEIPAKTKKAKKEKQKVTQTDKTKAKSKKAKE
jgi:ribosomal protein L13E